MLEDMERQLIERILTRHGGHRVKTAKALGMGVRTLGMKLKQWRDEGHEHGQMLVGSRRSCDAQELPVAQVMPIAVDSGFDSPETGNTNRVIAAWGNVKHHP